MKDESILKKAIEKACKNGYTICQRAFDLLMTLDVGRDKAFPNAGKALEYYMKEKHYCSYIFSHSFAKAFWGNELVRYGETKKEYIAGAKVREEFGKHSWIEDFWNREPKQETWQYHLQTMVLEKKPLKYIEQFLGELK